MEPSTVVTATPEPATHKKSPFIIGFVLLVLMGCAALIWLTSAPNNSGQVQVVVAPGMSVARIADAAKEAGVVRSSFLLYTLLTVRHDPTAIYAGVYSFPEPQSVFSVAERFGAGAIDDESIRVTIPEGMRAQDVAVLIAATLPNFDTETYSTLGTEQEGYLYPETYLVPETFTAASIITLQRETYEERVANLRAQIVSSGLTEYEVLILASIIEREANDEASMKMVSGIFQNRLAIGMALQADASIEYTLDIPLNELAPGELAESLREVDSPYNTYLYPGLPPTPISNPGLTAIRAVIEPTPSDYFFYLTDENGDFYYAETLDEHNDNIARYLR